MGVGVVVVKVKTSISFTHLRGRGDIRLHPPIPSMLGRGMLGWVVVVMGEGGGRDSNVTPRPTRQKLKGY